MEADPFFIYAEDSLDEVILVRAALRKLKLEHLLVHCANGEELMDCLRTLPDGEKATFILLDLRMPRMDGFEALRRIRQTPGLETLPVVVWSSSPLEKDIQLATALGANDYILKPGHLQELCAKVEELLARFHLTRGEGVE